MQEQQSQYCAVGTKGYRAILSELYANRKRTSRDILCSKCWKMNSFWQHKRHLKFFPDHEAFVVTAKDFCTERQLLALAKDTGNFKINEDGIRMVRSPLRVFGQRQNTIKQLEGELLNKKNKGIQNQQGQTSKISIQLDSGAFSGSESPQEDHSVGSAPAQGVTSLENLSLNFNKNDLLANAAGTTDQASKQPNGFISRHSTTITTHQSGSSLSLNWIGILSKECE